jgi:hypothetical protein
MENANKVTAIANVLATPQAAAQPGTALPAPRDTDDLVDHFEALMARRGDAGSRVAGVSEHSRLVSVVDGLAEDGLAVSEETDAIYNDEDASPDQVALRMGVLSEEMRLVGLQLKAFAEMSKQSREGVQTLIRS